MNAGQTLYHFVWNEFCDWYVEAAKLSLNSTETNKRQATQHTLKSTLLDTLKLLHPFLPFITEEIISSLDPNTANLIVSRYPKAMQTTSNTDSELFNKTVIEPVEAIRKIRGESNVQPGKKIPLTLSRYNDSKLVESANTVCNYVEHLAKTDKHQPFLEGRDPSETEHAATSVGNCATHFVPLAGLIDIDAETARLQKEIERKTNTINNLNKKLSNADFVKNAPAAVVEKERAKLAQSNETLQTLQDALKNLAK
jgi:valyl-tRNA synthetase